MISRPRISWSDLRGARVGIWGVGVEGRSNLGRLLAEGGQPILVDDRPLAGSVEGFPVLATSGGGIQALARCDVIVKTPGISRYRPEVEELRGKGIPVTGGLGLWMEQVDPTKVVCITGTKGKSTAVALCGHLLQGFGYDVLVGGNLGRPPYDVEAGTHDFYVVETSSFQATDLATSPPVVAVTALAPDHLDWHGDVQTYYRDKLSLTTSPGAALTVVADTPTLRAHEHLLGPKRQWVGANDPALSGPWLRHLGLSGAHNISNALVARAVLQAFDIPEAADEESLAAATQGFQPLESRFRPIGEVQGVTFVDDSLSTNTLPTIAALETLRERTVALIAGGFDRGIDYAPLARALAERNQPCMVAILDEAGERIAEAIGKQPGTTGVVTARASSMEEAAEKAWEWARPDGVVLLSPAAPSFGRYHDYRERAAAFAGAMRNIKEATRSD